MKSKIVAGTIFVLSLAMLAKDYDTLKTYLDIREANRNMMSKKYEKAREQYTKVLKNHNIEGIKENILKSYYQEKKYDEVVKYEYDNHFLKGNAHTYLGDSKKEEAKKEYDEAIAMYREALSNSKDVNIKKNYEIVLRKLEENKKQQQKQNQDKKDQKDQKQEQNQKQDKKNQKDQKQDKKDKQQNQKQQDKKQDKKDQQNKENKKEKQEKNDKQNQEQNKQNQDQKQDNNNENGKQNNDKQDKQQQNNQQDKQGQDKQKEQQDTQKQQAQGGQGEPKPMSKEEIKMQEVKALLKRLEGNEKQAFKNNERYINISNDNDKNSNRW